MKLKTRGKKEIGKGDDIGIKGRVWPRCSLYACQNQLYQKWLEVLTSSSVDIESTCVAKFTTFSLKIMREMTFGRP